MSPFWQRRQETDLERRLRSERPDAPDRLVRMLAARSRAGDRRLAPRLAVVAAVTAVMLVALGAVGTVGYAGTAMLSFDSSVRDMVRLSSKNVSKPKPSSASRSKPNAGKSVAGDPAQASPWQHQYHQKYPICHNGNTLYLPLPGYTAHLLHGDQPGVCP
jgi:hypothetical protein